MDMPLLHEEREWPFVLTLLPPDLEDSARQSQALVRCRNVPDAAALMRMALAYAVSDLSLKDVAAWAKALGVAQRGLSAATKTTKTSMPLR
jgi:acyl-CoA thioesterase